MDVAPFLSRISSHPCFPCGNHQIQWSIAEDKFFVLDGERCDIILRQPFKSFEENFDVSNCAMDARAHWASKSNQDDSACRARRFFMDRFAIGKMRGQTGEALLVPGGKLPYSRKFLDFRFA